jgi:hypothetical protein
VAVARRSSKALRSENYFYLNLKDNTPHGQIFSIAKFEKRNGDPAHSDVVFAFINLQPDLNVATPPGNTFNLDVDADNDGTNDFGIKPDHLYNVQNLAAYTGKDPNRKRVFLWQTPQGGSDLLKNGLTVIMNPVPSTEGDWGTKPYEAQYLKLIDVTTHN